MLFAYGWIFSSEVDAVSLDVLVQSQDPGKPICIERVRFQDWRLRQDVANSFPDFAQRALRSGWMVYARLSSSNVRDVTLEVYFENGQKYVIPVSLPEVLPVREVTQIPVGDKLAVLCRQGVKLMSLFINGQFRHGLRKIRKVLNSRPDGYIGSIRDFHEEMAGKKPQRGWKLVIDHDLGGGANKYRVEQARLSLAQGYGVVVLTTQISSLSDVVIIYVGDVYQRIRVRDKNDFLMWAKELGVQEVIYNNAVSFPDVVPTLEWMVRARSESGCRLVVNVHDYFALCPSQHLINADGRFCGIPAISDCHQCLATNKRSYVPIYAVDGIEAWRSSWKLLLTACDEIRFFSADSERLFLKVYAELHLKSKMTIVPHQVNVAPDRIKGRVKPAPLSIGIVGNINFEKGSAVIKKLADYIDQHSLPIRLKLFGSIDISVGSKCFDDVGPYAVDKLADLLVLHDINICFLPSICPETFSYACQEIIALGAPVACFNLGAPPERVRHYAYGLVLNSSPEASAELILQELISFHRSIYVT